MPVTDEDLTYFQRRLRLLRRSHRNRTAGSMRYGPRLDSNTTREPIDFGTSSTSGAEISGNGSWTHTPVSSRPSGAVMLITQRATNADEVLTATYGGRSMDRAAYAGDPTNEIGAAYAYFLGDCPPGAQTAAFTVISGNAGAYRAYLLTTSGAGKTRLLATASLSDDQANPTLALLTPDNVNSFCCGAIFSGLPAASIAPNAGMTEIAEIDLAAGSRTFSFIRRTAIANGGLINIGWTGTIDDVAAVGVAIGPA